MNIQPPADGSHMPRQMESRVAERGGRKPPTPYDKALCAKARAKALKSQREAMAVSVPKTDAAQQRRQKSS